MGIVQATSSSPGPRPAAPSAAGQAPIARLIDEIIARAKVGISPARVPGAAMTLTFSSRTITLDMIRDSFAGIEDRFPPILSLTQAANLVGLQEQTLRKHLSEGKYTRSSRRGHPVRFMRDVFVLEYMSGGLK